MAEATKPYPDVADILARKERGRTARASLSFAEKLDALDALRARVEPLVRARKMRSGDRPCNPGTD
jgi:hypothetical protein